MSHDRLANAVSDGGCITIPTFVEQRLMKFGRFIPSTQPEYRFRLQGCHR